MSLVCAWRGSKDPNNICLTSVGSVELALGTVLRGTEEGGEAMTAGFRGTEALLVRLCGGI